jgi:hypothetical protein
MKHKRITESFIEKINTYLNNVNDLKVIDNTSLEMLRLKYKVDNNIFYSAVSMGYFEKCGKVYTSKVTFFEPKHSRDLIEYNREYHRKWVQTAEKGRKYQTSSNVVEVEPVAPEPVKPIVVSEAKKPKKKKDVETEMHKYAEKPYIKPIKRKFSILWGLMSFEY